MNDRLFDAFWYQEMSSQVELIDFFRPNSNRKNLFITNISGTLNEEDILVELYNTFEKYGLVYRVQIYPTSFKQKLETDPTTEKNQECEKMFYYAFVTFYSMLDAAKAKNDLNSSICIGDNLCKVAFAKKKKEIDDHKVLYFCKCYELVNYYLGSNSWSTQIKTMFEDTDSRVDTDQTVSIKYVCLITLTVQDLRTEGIGVCQESFSKSDPLSKIKAVCKCKKICYGNAVENAFSKVLLVVLDNGKVSVEIDTTKPDFHSNNLPDEQLVKVNTLDVQPESEEAMAEGEVSCNLSASNIDDINLQILQELETDMT